MPSSNNGTEDWKGNIIADLREVLKLWENYITELYNRPENLDAEPKEEVDADEKGPYILESEEEKSIKEMRGKKATWDDDVPGNVLKLWGDSLTLMTQLINNMYENEEWQTDFIEVTMPTLKQVPNICAMAIVQLPLSHIKQR